MEPVNEGRMDDSPKYIFEQYEHVSISFLFWGSMLNLGGVSSCGAKGYRSGISSTRGRGIVGPWRRDRRESRHRSSWVSTCQLVGVGPTSMDIMMGCPSINGRWGN